jgi:hypothetical protein
MQVSERWGVTAGKDKKSQEAFPQKEKGQKDPIPL